MLVPRKLAEYHEAFNEVALDLVDVLRKERGKEDVFLDVPGTMNRWSFECEFQTITELWYISVYEIMIIYMPSNNIV